MAKSNNTSKRINYISNFTIVTNKIINSKTLTMESKTLIIFMISKPAPWDFSYAYLIRNINGMTRHRLIRAIKQLRDEKYLEKEFKRTENGKLNGVNWIVNANL